MSKRAYEYKNDERPRVRIGLWLFAICLLPFVVLVGAVAYAYLLGPIGRAAAIQFDFSGQAGSLGLAVAIVMAGSLILLNCRRVGRTLCRAALRLAREIPNPVGPRPGEVFGEDKEVPLAATLGVVLVVNGLILLTVILLGLIPPK